MAQASKTNDKQQALDELRSLLNPGDELRTILRHVSPSGMTRWVDVYAVRDSDLRYLSWFAAKAAGYPVNQGNRDGVKLGGCGYDVGFELVYSIGRALWPEGFECVGDRCSSNDHSNGDRDYTPGHCIHSDGGYALRQRWI